MIRDAIIKVAAGNDLTMEEAAAVMEEIMTGEVTPAQVGALLTALHMKGETAEEIAGMARVMRAKALRVEVDSPAVDTCGTGGDAKGTFNISTAAADAHDSYTRRGKWFQQTRSPHRRFTGSQRTHCGRW